MPPKAKMQLPELLILLQLHPKSVRYLAQKFEVEETTILSGINRLRKKGYNITVKEGFYKCN